MSALGCTGILSPVCQAAGSAGSSIAGASAGSVLGAMADWVVEGASWLLGQIGGALTSSTSVDLGAGWFTSHYQVMVGLGAVVLLPLFLLSVVQAVYRQSAAVLIRVVGVQLPLALLLAGVAVQLVQLSLAATDALGTTVSAGAGDDIQRALSGVSGLLVSQLAGGPGSAPTFVVLLGALLVAFGAFALWMELIVRAAAVYVAVLFLPLALASLVWPAISHWCRRLVDTLVALILAKFVIVAILSLAVAALGSGTQTGFAAVLAGGALLLLAAFAPFTLLRLVPAVEAGAVHQLEGARHRVQQAFGSVPRSAAGHALRAARSAALVAGEPGPETTATFGRPGDEDGPTGEGGDAGSGVFGGDGPDGMGRILSADRSGSGHSDSAADRGDPTDLGIPQWRGVPPTAAGSSESLPTPERPPWTLADPLGRGPMPVWGAPVADPDRDDTAADRPFRASLTITRDEMGPVISRWRPVDGSGPTTDGGRAGRAPAVERGQGGGDDGA